MTIKANLTGSGIAPLAAIGIAGGGAEAFGSCTRCGDVRTGIQGDRGLSRTVIDAEGDRHVFQVGGGNLVGHCIFPGAHAIPFNGIVAGGHLHHIAAGISEHAVFVDLEIAGAGVNLVAAC